MAPKVTIIGFTFDVLLVVGLNVVQTGVAMSASNGDRSYGLPFAFYEYLVNFNRGRLVGYGLIGDVAFALILGGIFAVIFRELSAAPSAENEG